MQEFFSNTIKHSRASILKVCIHYKEEYIVIIVEDNGVGFLPNEKKEGIGLSNIKNRAKLIGAIAKFSSEKNKGTTLEIQYKL